MPISAIAFAEKSAVFRAIFWIRPIGGSTRGNFFAINGVGMLRRRMRGMDLPMLFPFYALNIFGIIIVFVEIDVMSHTTSTYVINAVFYIVLVRYLMSWNPFRAGIVVYKKISFAAERVFLLGIFGVTRHKRRVGGE